ncbi:MAG: M24 family metallopeptidase [Thermomicrobiales bacterium]
MIPHRLTKLAAALTREGADAIVVTEPASRFYLTGWGMFDAQPGESAYWVLADPDGMTILTGIHNVVEARGAAPDSRIIGLSNAERRAIAARMARLINDAGYRQVAFDDFHLGTGRFHELRNALSMGIELVPAADMIRTIRAVKEPGEIAAIREAVRITDDAYVRMIEWLKPGRTEKEAAWFLEKDMKEHGSVGLAFDIILAAGPGGAVPHHEPTDRPIREGEPCWVDFGARVDGYCADMTRSFCLGRPDGRLQEVYDAVIASLDTGIAALTLGSHGTVAADRAAAEIETRGLPVGHILGHGIGLQVHELPSVGPGSLVMLEEGMIITAEPGVYFPDWGGVRVEDDALVTADGPIVLNRSPRQLTVV